MRAQLRVHPLRFFLTLALFALGIYLAPTIWLWPVALLLCFGLYRAFHPGLLKIAVALALSVFVILESALLAFMIRDGIVPDEFRGDETMIVLGGGILGLEPDLYLRLRLDEAARLLEKYPRMPVIVTGSQAEDEAAAEAVVMRDYLIRQGVARERIITEIQGYDTLRNFAFSRAIIEDKALSRRVVVVTNDFHSFRSAAIARSEDLTPVSVSVPSPGPAFLKFLLRETASLIKVQLYYGPRLRRP